MAVNLEKELRMADDKIFRMRQEVALLRKENENLKAGLTEMQQGIYDFDQRGQIVPIEVKNWVYRITTKLIGVSPQ
jgi:FtsZ-binding cell division protein ZapB